MYPRAGASVLLATVILAVGASFAAAQAPAPAVALVLEAEATTPTQRPYREIRSGTTVSLPAGGRLVFLMYGSCRTMTVEGAGSVTFTSGLVPILKGATTRGDVRGQCPKKFVASATDAATVMRSVLPALSSSPRPEFVFVGLRSEDFGEIRIRKADGADVLTRSLTGPRFLWPADAPPLEPGRYALHLQPRPSGPVPVIVEFKASPETPEAVTLITID